MVPMGIRLAALGPFRSHSARVPLMKYRNATNKIPMISMENIFMDFSFNFDGTTGNEIPKINNTMYTMTFPAVALPKMMMGGVLAGRLKENPNLLINRSGAYCMNGNTAE